MRTFSAREIAHRLAPTAEVEESTFQRIRAWTAIGLLRPSVEYPGTGRKREYPESEVKKARILNALANFDVSTKTMKDVVFWLDRGTLRDDRMEETPLYLIISKTPTGTAVETEVYISGFTLTPSDDCVLIVNLKRLWIV